MPKKHTNPTGVSKPMGFTHVVEATGATRLIYVAGQTAANANGEVVGIGDFRAQVQQVYENLKACLESHGASFADVVRTTDGDVSVKTEPTRSWFEPRCGNGSGMATKPACMDPRNARM